MPHAIIVRQPGGPDTLVWGEVKVGEPGPGQVRLRQTAVGLNFIDVYHRTGLYPQPTPFIPGVEAAGTVERVGPDVEGLKPGDRVAYAGPVGAYAEVRLIAADRLVRLPDEIGDEQAAAALLQGMTVHMLLRRVHAVQPGDTILVHAAAGGVGLIMCQWAKALGATVIGTVSTDEKAEIASAHGCTHPIVTTHQDFVAEVERITNGEKLAIAYDSVGRDTFMRSLDCLRPRGLMVSSGNASGPVEPFSPLLLSQKGSLFLTRPTLFHYIAARSDLEQAAQELFDMVLGGQIKIEVKQRFRLRDAAEAHRALEARQTTGSTVLTL